MITEILKKLNLSEKEAKVYLASLELGSTTVQKIAKKAGFPRSSTYLLLDELKSKGLISQTKVGKKTILTASSPQRLIQLAQQQKKQKEKTLKELNKALPQLQALYQKTPKKPSVYFYEGFEGIKNILEETLQAKKILVLCSGYKEPMEKKLYQYMSSYFHKVLAKKIPTFEIIGGSPDAKKYQKECSSEINKIKIVPHAKGCQHIDKMIFENKVAIVSYEYLNGVVIKNKQIADYEKALFWQLWKITK